MANSNKLLHNGLNEQNKMDEDPKKYGMDNKGKDQKPMSTPKQSVSEKGKNFTIC